MTSINLEYSVKDTYIQSSSRRTYTICSGYTPYYVYISTDSRCECVSSPSCLHIDYVLKHVLKTDKTIDDLKSIHVLLEVFNGNKPLTNDDWLKVVKEEWSLVKHAPQELYPHLVEKCPSCFPFIEHQTQELCKLAIEKYIFFVKNVKHQTPELCREVIQKNIKNIKYVNFDQIDIKDLFKTLIFEDLNNNKFITLGMEITETTIIDKMYKHIGLIYGSALKENAIELYDSKKTMDEIVKDKKVAGVYIIKVNDNLYEMYTKNIEKVNNGWIRNNYIEVVKNEKVGRFIVS